jgi:hypothetical protein
MNISAVIQIPIAIMKISVIIQIPAAMIISSLFEISTEMEIFAIIHI